MCKFRYSFNILNYVNVFTYILGSLPFFKVFGS